VRPTSRTNGPSRSVASDRHHFRFIVSPDDAAEMTDLRAFARELVADMERDLGTKLDWIGVDHYNTDNRHLHILVRGKADDDRDLVISPPSRFMESLCLIAQRQADYLRHRKLASPLEWSRFRVDPAAAESSAY
jgi:type IV secretory pathway VirD2 relaxase